MRDLFASIRDSGWGEAIAWTIVAIGIVIAWQYYEERREDEPFAPLEVLRFELEGGSVYPGGSATLLNGLCNKTGDIVDAEVWLAAQTTSTDPLFQVTITIFGTPEADGERLITVPPGCLEESHLIEAIVPDNMPAGTYTLVAIIIARGPHGQIQRIPLQSNPFDVVTDQQMTVVELPHDGSD